MSPGAVASALIEGGRGPEGPRGKPRKRIFVGWTFRERAPWKGDYVFSSGDLVEDLTHDLFVETGARYNKLKVL